MLCAGCPRVERKLADSYSASQTTTAREIEGRSWWGLRGRRVRQTAVVGSQKRLTRCFKLYFYPSAGGFEKRRCFSWTLNCEPAALIFAKSQKQTNTRGSLLRRLQYVTDENRFHWTIFFAVFQADIFFYSVGEPEKTTEEKIMFPWEGVRPTIVQYFFWWLYVSFRRLRGILSQILSDLIRITSYGICLVEKMFLDFIDDKIWPNVFFWPYSTGFESDWKRFCTRPRRHYATIYGL